MLARCELRQASKTQANTLGGNTMTLRREYTRDRMIKIIKEEFPPYEVIGLCEIARLFIVQETVRELRELCIFCGAPRIGSVDGIILPLDGMANFCYECGAGPHSAQACFR